MPATNLYDHTIEHAKESDYVGLEVLQYYITSIGCHIANLFNQGDSVFEYAQPFYFRNRRPFPIRGNIFAVGPPGSGKTIWHKFFFEQKYGCALSLPHKHEKRLTELSLIGGFDKFGDKIEGHAERFKDAIILCDEYSAFQKSSKQEHSLHLEEAMLGLLDDGWVRKSTGGKDIEYQSFVTCWLATQNTRFDAESGMPRRLNYLDMSLSRDMLEQLNEKIIENENKPPKTEGVRDLRSHFGEIINDFSASKSERTDSLKAFLRSLSKMGYDHNELILTENLAIGYSLIKFYRGSPVLRITVDKTFRDFAVDALKRRQIILTDASFGQVIKYVESFKDGCPQTQLLRYLTATGWSRTRSRDTINDMLMGDYLVKHGGEGLGQGKGKTPVSYTLAKEAGT